MAVNIRMPEEMHKAIVKIAETEFRSVTSLILQLLDEALRAKNVEWRIEEEDYPSAQEAYEQAVEIARQMGDEATPMLNEARRKLAESYAVEGEG